MNKSYLLFLLFPITISVAFADYPIALNIPPTNAFDKIHTQSGSVSAVNYSMPLIIRGAGTASVIANNSTHTITITATSTGGGTYNTTQANNVNINTGGFKINFINGSGSTINVVNSKSSTQVNVTISSTGSGGTITNVQGTTGNITSTCIAGVCTVNTGNNIVVNNNSNNYTAGKDQFFITNATRAGLNINSLFSQPSNLKNGDCWIDNVVNSRLKCFINRQVVFLAGLQGSANTYININNFNGGFNTTGSYTSITPMNTTSDLTKSQVTKNQCVLERYTGNATTKWICNTGGIMMYVSSN